MNGIAKETRVGHTGAAPSHPLLNWVLSRGRETLTCRLDRANDQFRVSLLPDGESERGLFAVFDAGLSAFQRHAAVVRQLRGFGWSLVDYR